MDLKQIYDVVAEATRDVGDVLYWYVFFNPIATFVIFWSIIILLFVWGIRRYLKRNKTGENYKMAQRKAYLDRVFADMIGDGLTELYLSNKINAQEYRKYFKFFGIKHGLSDLMPRTIHPSAIKHRVRRNVSTMKLVDENGVPIQPSIPGPKPGTVTLPPTRKPKVWVAVRKRVYGK